MPPIHLRGVSGFGVKVCVCVCMALVGHAGFEKRGGDGGQPDVVQERWLSLPICHWRSTPSTLEATRQC